MLCHCIAINFNYASGGISIIRVFDKLKKSNKFI